MDSETNIIAPRSVSRRKFEDDTLIKHKARLVVRGCILIPGVGYRDPDLCGPVVRLKTPRTSS